MSREYTFKERLLRELYKYVTESQMTRDVGILLVLIHLIVHSLLVNNPKAFVDAIFKNQ